MCFLIENMWFSKRLNLTIRTNTMLWGSIRTFLRMLFMMSFITKVTKSLRENGFESLLGNILFTVLWTFKQMISNWQDFKLCLGAPWMFSSPWQQRSSSATHDRQTFSAHVQALLHLLFWYEPQQQCSSVCWIYASSRSKDSDKLKHH